MTQEQRGAAFRALHDGPAFVIPNPWDAGSAKVLAGLGFQALATTSSGFAFTLGRPDGDASLDEVIEHTRAIAAATPLPVSVDLENGHGDPAAAISRAAEAGAVGGSIEDWDPEAGSLYEPGEAAERVAAGVEAARAAGFPFTLTARAENLLHGDPDVDHSIERLLAYEEAGADVLYAPGLRDAGQIRAVCEAVSRPVNVLAHRRLNAAEIAEAGAKRISVGGALTWVAVSALAEAAAEIRDSGDFSVLGKRPPIEDWL